MPIKLIQTLPLSPILRVIAEQLPADEQAAMAMKRAKHILNAYCDGFTEEDVKFCTSKFWNVHIDPIVCVDGVATSLLTIQINLAAGTLASYVDEQPHHRDLLQRMLRFEVSGQFCLTELDHGLDALNIETIATVLPGGGFELHTPHPGAAKYMPPTHPCGIPCFAIVFARLMSKGEFFGIKSFVVQLSNGTSMMPGISSRALPARRSVPHASHCLTYFDRVKLSADAILGDCNRVPNHRLGFLQSIWRVATGSLAIGSIAIPTLQTVAFVAGRYSQRRMVDGGTKAVLTFKTQHAPILIALCQSFVLKEFWKVATSLFNDESVDHRVRHGVAATFKAVALQHAQTANLVLSERCGAQGLFDYNQICNLHAVMRGVAIAEGDLLGLSIRLASELILGRYSLPASMHEGSLLNRHERGLLSDCRHILGGTGDHRSDEFSRQLLPRAEKIVQSIGHRMAYDAAVESGVDKRITDLYLWSAIRLDEVWYSENLGISAARQFVAEDDALRAALPMLDTWLDDTGVEPYVSAPIISKDRWEEFVAGLKMVSTPQQSPLRGAEKARL